jgi:hypothetical protein
VEVITIEVADWRPWEAARQLELGVAASRDLRHHRRHGAEATEVLETASKRG